MTNLRQTIRNSSQHNKIPGTVIDVLGDACAVRLSTNGRVLRGIPFTGGPPSAGDTVLVDYASGEPVALIRGNAAMASVSKTSLKNANVVTDIPPGQLQGSGGIVSGVYYAVLRYPGAGGEPSVYEYSATGLTAALTDASASSGDLVFIFGADPITGDFTVPADTSLMGLSKWDTVLFGTVTMTASSVLQSLTIHDITADATDAVAVEGPATGKAIVENCLLLAECSSTGSASAFYFPTPSTASLAVNDSYFFANSASGTFAQGVRSEVGNLNNNITAFNCTFTNYTDITTAVDANWLITSARTTLRWYACVYQFDSPIPVNLIYQPGDRRPMYEIYSISANTTIDDTDALVICDTSGGAFTVTLPGIGAQSRKITVTNTGTLTLTVDGSGAQTINGNLTLSILYQNSTAQLMSIAGGTDWRIV